MAHQHAEQDGSKPLPRLSVWRCSDDGAALRHEAAERTARIQRHHQEKSSVRSCRSPYRIRDVVLEPGHGRVVVVKDRHQAVVRREPQRLLPLRAQIRPQLCGTCVPLPLFSSLTNIVDNHFEGILAAPGWKQPYAEDDRTPPFTVAQLAEDGVLPSRLPLLPLRRERHFARSPLHAQRSNTSPATSATARWHPGDGRGATTGRPRPDSQIEASSLLSDTAAPWGRSLLSCAVCCRRSPRARTRTSSQR
jgi:hypothetical protein